MSYDYNRTSKTAAKVDPLKKVMNDWLESVAKEIGKALPSNLTSEGSKTRLGQTIYAEVQAKGYSKSDLECSLSIGMTIDNTPFRVRAFASYKDAMMSRNAEQEFSVAYDEDPTKIAQDVARWLQNF